MAAKVSSTAKDCVHALITGPPGIGKTTLVRSVCQLLQEKHNITDLHGFYTEEVRVGGAGGGRGSGRVGFDVVTFEGVRGSLARVEGAEHHHGNHNPTTRQRKPIYVGKYIVNLESFESIALPTLSLQQQVKDVHLVPNKDTTSSRTQTNKEIVTSDDGIDLVVKDSEKVAEQREVVERKGVKESERGEGGMKKKRTLFVVDEIGKMELFSRQFVQSVQSLFQTSGRDGVVVLATIPVARHKSHWLVEELRQRDDCRLFEVTQKNRDELVKTISDFLLQRIS